MGNTSWLGWQFDRPDLGTGMVQIFRRSASIYKAADLRLYLDPEACYQMKNLDSLTTEIITGRQLMDGGVPVVLNERPSAGVFPLLGFTARFRVSPAPAPTPNPAGRERLA